MAEMNELLDQAIQECEGLTAEASAFAEELAGTVADVVDLQGTTVQRGDASLRLLDVTLQVLRENDRLLDEAEEKQTAELGVLDQEIDRSREATSEALDRAADMMEDLRRQKERVAEEVSAGTERTPEAVEALEDALSEMEEQTEEQLSQAEEAVEGLEEAVRNGIEDFRAAEGELESRFEEAEAELLQLTEETLDAYDEAVEQAETSSRTLLEAVSAHVEETVAQLAHGFTEDVPAALDEGMHALDDSLRGVLDSGEKSATELQLDLQLLLENWKRSMELMSNILKAMHDTQMTIIRNIRG